MNQLRASQKLPFKVARGVGRAGEMVIDPGAAAGRLAGRGVTWLSASRESLPQLIERSADGFWRMDDINDALIDDILKKATSEKVKATSLSKYLAENVDTLTDQLTDSEMMRLHVIAKVMEEASESLSPARIMNLASVGKKWLGKATQVTGTLGGLRFGRPEWVVAGLLVGAGIDKVFEKLPPLQRQYLSLIHI